MDEKLSGPTRAGAPRDEGSGAEDVTRVGSAAPSPDAKRPRPARFGRYEIRREIARGGMGVVYEALDPQLQRCVALKVMLGNEAWASDTHIERFQREARAAARLHHPNIVAVYDVGRADGKHYFTMELVDGESLAGRIHREGAMPPREAAEIAATLAKAVHHAHLEGIVHRDLKPSNVLLARDGRVLVTDFGLAKETRGGTDMTQSGAIVGTPCYMAPEQAAGRGREVDPRTDVYALGAVLYEMLTALPPFLADEAMEILQKIQNEEPRSVQEIRPEVPIDLRTIVAKAMEKDKGRRYASSALLAQDLDRFLSGDPILARPLGLLDRAWRRARRNRAAAVLLLALVVVLVGGASWIAGRTIVQRVRLADAVRQAEEALAKGQLEQAAEQAERAMGIAPEDGRGRLLLKRAQSMRAVEQGRISARAHHDLWERVKAMESETGHVGSPGPGAGDARAERWERQSRLQDARAEQERAWVEAVGHFTRAYGLWEENPTAAEGLAELYWARYVEAESLRDATALVTYEALVRQFGGDSYGKRLEGWKNVEVDLHLPVGQSPEAVEAYLFRYEKARRPPVLVPVPCDPETGTPLAPVADPPYEPLPLDEAEIPDDEYAEIENEARQVASGDEPGTAIPLYYGLTALRPWDAAPCLALARICALTGRHDWGLNALEEGVRRGFADVRSLEMDEALSELRGHSRFRIVLAALRGQIPRRAVVVTTIEEGSAGQQAGVRLGDVVTAVAGNEVGSEEDLKRAVEADPGEKDWSLDLYRPEMGTVRCEVPGGRPLGVGVSQMDLDAGASGRGSSGAARRTREVRRGSALGLAPGSRHRVPLRAKGDSARLSLRLPRGSYLLWIPDGGPQGLAECRYPFIVSSDIDWRGEKARLRANAEVPPGFVQVPAGPFRVTEDPDAVRDKIRGRENLRCEDFLLARFEVPSWLYLLFLNDSEFQTADEAAVRVPRSSQTTFWGQDDETSLISIADREWHLDFPVCGISRADVEAFCRWYTQRRGTGKWRFRVPTEEEWEKAARGVDGRFFPWGDVADPAFGRIDDSRTYADGTPHLEPYGLFPMDESPFGVRDLAGGVQEWAGLRTDVDCVAKGGAWCMEVASARAASRNSGPGSFVTPALGFRLVAELIQGK